MISGVKGGVGKDEERLADRNDRNKKDGEREEGKRKAKAKAEILVSKELS